MSFAFHSRSAPHAPRLSVLGPGHCGIFGVCTLFASHACARSDYWALYVVVAPFECSHTLRAFRLFGTVVSLVLYWRAALCAPLLRLTRARVPIIWHYVVALECSHTLRAFRLFGTRSFLVYWAAALGALPPVGPRCARPSRRLVAALLGCLAGVACNGHEARDSFRPQHPATRHPTRSTNGG